MFNFGGPTGFDTAGGGFIPGSFNLGFNADTNQQPSLYSPLMAATIDTYRKNCVPLKIGMIWKAYNASPNTPRIIIDGEEVGVMQVVGTLHNFEAIEDGGADKFTFDLADGTGVIKIEWLVGVKSEAKSDYEEQVLQEFQTIAQSGVPFFLSVCGEINLRGVHFPRIKAHTCDRLLNPHQIFHHDLLIMDIRLAFLKKENISGLSNSQRWSVSGDMADPLPVTLNESAANFYESPNRQASSQINVRPVPTPQTLTPSRPTPPRNQTPMRPQGPATATAESQGVVSSDLPKRVLAFLTPMKDSHQQGVHVKVITSQLSKEMPGLTVEKVRQALVVLEDAGEAYFGRNNDMWCAI